MAHWSRALIVARWPIQRHAGAILLGAVGVFGLSIVVFGLSHNLWLVAAGPHHPGRVRHGQRRHSSGPGLGENTGRDARGARVSAVESVFIGASNELGEFESGVTAAWFGVVPAVVLGRAGGTLAVVGLWARIFPQLRQVDSLEGERLEKTLGADSPQKVGSVPIRTAVQIQIDPENSSVGFVPCLPHTMSKVITITALFLLSASVGSGPAICGTGGFRPRPPPAFQSSLPPNPDAAIGAYRQAYALFEKRLARGPIRSARAGQRVCGMDRRDRPDRTAFLLSLRKSVSRFHPSGTTPRSGWLCSWSPYRHSRQSPARFSRAMSRLRPSQGGEKEYRLSATGELDWVRFMEPEESDADPVKEHRHPPELRLYGKDIPGLDGDYALNLVLENTRTRARVTLEGPVLENFPALLQIKKPQSGVLGFAQAMNPLQKGGRMGLAQDRLAL